MSDTILASVPLISMKDQAGDPEGFAQELGASFKRFGFAMVSDHGVPDDVVERAWAMTKAFFALPEEEKRRYFVPSGGGARGLTPADGRCVMTRRTATKPRRTRTNLTDGN